MTFERVLQIPEADVWLGQLDLSAEEFERLADLITSDELEQSLSYGDIVLRRRFVARRAMLRTLLGAELGKEPRAVPLSRTESGKPVMNDAALHFSVSSSGGVAVVATSRQSPIGVDVERHRPFPIEPTASTHFTERERFAPFFALWTRKEACAKALGLGLLDSFACFETPWPVDAEFHRVAWPGGELAVRDLPEMPDLQVALAQWRPTSETVAPFRSSIE